MPSAPPGPARRPQAEAKEIDDEEEVFIQTENEDVRPHLETSLDRKRSKPTPRSSPARLCDAYVPELGWIRARRCEEEEEDEAESSETCVVRPLFQDPSLELEFHATHLAPFGTRALHPQELPEADQAVDVLHAGAWRSGRVETLFQHPQTKKDFMRIRLFRHPASVETSEGLVEVVLPLHSARVRPFLRETARRRTDEEEDALIAQHASPASSSASNQNPVLSREVSRFTARLEAMGWRRVAQLGDGNCLFRSASFLIYGTDAHHELIRRTVASYEWLERARFEMFVDTELTGGFEAYVESLARSGVWGDDPELQALGEIYQVSVLVFGAKRSTGEIVLLRRLESELLPGESTASASELRFSYYGNGHYDALVPTTSSTSIPPTSSSSAAPQTPPLYACLLPPETAGQAERRALEQAETRRAGGTRLAVLASDAEATEREQMEQALRLSERLAEEESWARAVAESARGGILAEEEEDDEDDLVRLAIEESLRDATG